MTNIQSFHREAPPELWVDIFQWACCHILDEEFSIHRNTSEERPGSLHPRNQILVIRNVCKQWREIIQSSSLFWSKISLHDCWTFPRGPGPAPLNEVDIEEHFLTRTHLLSDILHYSENRPLHILFCPPCHDNTLKIILLYVKMLAKHSERWVQLYIYQHQDSDSPGVNYPSPALTFICSLTLLQISALPSLERLEFDVRGGIDDRASPGLAYGLPELRTLSVRSGPAALSLLPWSNLSKIEFTDVPHTGCRNVFPHLHSAVEIRIVRCFGLDGIDQAVMEPDQVPFTLEHLRVLDLDFWDVHLFALMAAPRLDKLEVTWLSDFHVQEVVSFIARSQCLITTFRCHDSALDRDEEDPDTDIHPLLASLPALTELSYYFSASQLYHDVEAFSEPLNRMSNDEMMYCPHLEELSIRCYTILNQPEYMVLLVNVIEARWMAGHLRKVMIPMWGMGSLRSLAPQYRQVYAEQYLRLSHLKREGLDLRLEYFGA